jgi:hypothetical protein
VIVCTRFVPRGFSAMTVWPLIFVRPECRHDAALIGHELVHYNEQRWTTPVWIARYLLSRKFRLAAEVRGYQRQIALGGITQAQAAQMLTRYRLGITLVQAREALAFIGAPAGAEG